MSKLVRVFWILPVLVLAAAPAILAGEPLVVKTAEGKYLPAVAAEWAKTGETFRFVLKAGTNAKKVAAELKDQIAPLTVEAPDDLTLVFKGKDLTEQDLLEKLAGIPLGKEAARKDALAALANLGDEGGPALSDLSSAGSIRASKKIELPKPEQRKKDPGNLVGKVVKVHPCEPMPTLEIKVTAVPSEGEHKAAFKKNKKIAVRGFYKVESDTNRKIDPNEARTKINLKTKEIKPGAVVFGKPFLKDGKVWVLETIEKM